MLEDDISEEMADVIIMLVQLQMIYNNKEEVDFLTESTNCFRACLVSLHLREKVL